MPHAFKEKATLAVDWLTAVRQVLAAGRQLIEPAQLASRRKLALPLVANQHWQSFVAFPLRLSAYLVQRTFSAPTNFSASSTFNKSRLGLPASFHAA
jgi:hypothetical protein